MHSHHHHLTTAGNHRLPPQMHLQPLSTSLPTTTNNLNSLQYLHPYDCDDSLTTDSPPPARSLSSSSASINHKEAEKRRRERINSHLNRLRNLLPCNSKTDKASLLAKVVQRLKELKQITSEIKHHESIPSDTDEISVISLNNNQGDEKIVIKASMCCENRSNLLAEIIGTLNSLKLSLLKVEMVAMGGRIRNVVVVECDWRRDDDCGELIECLKETLSCLVTSDLGSNQSSKRRRMMRCR